MTSRTLAKKIADFALSKKASEVLMMDLRKLHAPADFFVVCSADSDTHVRAIADAVKHGTADIGVSLWHSEGFRALSWVLLDYSDVVVHVFKRDVRPFYNLERLWGDAKLIAVEDTPPVRPAANAAKKPAKPRAPRKKKTV